MGTIESQGQNWILTIPKKLIHEKEIQRILDLVRFHELTNNSEITEKKAFQLSEEIKEDWWQINKSRILSKIKEV